MKLWKKLSRVSKSKEDISSEMSLGDHEKTMIFGIEVKKLPPEILKEVETVTRESPWEDTEVLTLETLKRISGVSDEMFESANAATEALRKLTIMSSYLESFDVEPSSSRSPSEQRRLMLIQLVMREVDRVKKGVSRSGW